MPLTSYPGRESDVSLSPDGDQLAFVRYGEDGANGDVFVRGMDSEVPVPVSEHAAREALPVWSPDGRELAYVRYEDEITWLRTWTVVDRSERSVAPLAAERIYGLCWSPDGRWLTFAQRPAAGETVAIFRIEVETGFRERLTAPPAGILGDLDPAWSPDGRELVFVRRGALAVSDLFALDLNRGTIRRLTDLGETVLRPVWSPDGLAVLFVRWRSDRYGLSWVSRAGGETRDLELGSEHIVRAAVASSSDGGLVVERLRADTDLWRLDLSDSPRPVRWMSSTATDRLPAISADNRRLAFVSERSGRTELWVADGSSAYAERLTFSPTIRPTQRLLGRPQWSPDGHWIAFDSRAAGQVDVFVVPSTGGAEIRLTEHSGQDVLPSWSRDGRVLYFSSNRSGRWQIWRRVLPADPAEWPGEVQRVTRDGGLTVAESFDGRWLYYVKAAGISGLWRQPVGGGNESLVLVDFDPTVDWALTPEGVFYVDRDAAATGAVIYRELPQGEARTVWQLDRPARELGLAASGDGRFLTLGLLGTDESDLFLTRWSLR